MPCRGWLSIVFHILWRLCKRFAELSRKSFPMLVAMDHPAQNFQFISNETLIHSAAKHFLSLYILLCHGLSAKNIRNALAGAAVTIGIGCLAHGTIGTFIFQQPLKFGIDGFLAGPHQL